MNFKCILILLGCLFSQIGYAQVNLSGKSGLIYIPDAQEVKDGSFRIGFHYNPKEYALRSKRKVNNEHVWFASLHLLPRLEISLSLLQMQSTPQHPTKIGLGDRQLDLRYLILKETPKRPSLAVVMSSPFTIDAAMMTQVLVATKTFALAEDWKLQSTLGVGSPYFIYRDEDNLTNSNIFSNFKWQKKSDYIHNNGYLTGVLGGLKLAFKERAGLMVEWDSQKLNVGAYGQPLKGWTVQAGLLEGKKLMWGSSISLDLLKKK